MPNKRRLLSRLLRWIVGICPVFLAACYGPQYYPEPDWIGPGQDGLDDQQTNNPLERRGVVVDSVTSAPIAGIRVTCVSVRPDPSVAVTDADGRFVLTLKADEICTGYAFDDIDGDVNGVYASKVVGWCTDCEELTVQLSLSSPDTP